MAKVLVVEDSAFDRKIIRAVLEKARYVVVEAENGEMGLRLLAEASPDCVLVDIFMPVMGGTTMIEQMKDQGNATPVLVLTSDEEPVTEQKCAKLGAVFFLRKPVGEEELRDCVAGALHATPG